MRTALNVHTQGDNGTVSEMASGQVPQRASERAQRAFVRTVDKRMMGRSIRLRCS
jgi:hypothetical protein